MKCSGVRVPGPSTYACRALYLLLVIALSPPSIADAASYDCEKSVTNVELAICGDDTLSAADSEMAALYVEARQKDATLSTTQISWLHTVRDLCEDVECLSRAYAERIRVLETALRPRSTLTAPSQTEKQNVPEATSRAIAQTIPNTVEQTPASFECGSAVSPAELVICHDENLSIADKEVAKQVSGMVAAWPQVAQNQALWISNTRNKCVDAKCLSSAYLARLNELETKALSTPAAESPSIQAEPTPESPTPHLGSVTPQPNKIREFVQGNIEAPSTLVTWCLWGAFGFVIFMLALGANREIVICYGAMDFFWAAAPILFGLIGSMIFSSISNGQQVAEYSTEQKLVIVFTASLITHSIIKTYVNAVRYNQSIFIGLVVGTFKLLVGAGSILIIFGLLAGATNKEKSRNRSNPIAVLLLLGFLFWVFRAVLNGPEVFEKKGWDPLPA